MNEQNELKHYSVPGMRWGYIYNFIKNGQIIYDTLKYNIKVVDGW